MAGVSSRTPVAGVGASAGGVEALEEFFAGLPSDPGLVIVIITHLNPDHENLLDEIIARRELFSLARRGLRLDVRAAFREAVETGRRVRRNGIKFEADDGVQQTLSLTVEPAFDP